MRWSSLSIRLRLLAAGTAGVVLSLLLAAWGLAVLFDRHVERVAASDLDDRIEHLAMEVELGAGGALVMTEPPRDPLYQRPYSGHYWQISAQESEMRSRSLWDYALSLPDGPDATWQGLLPGPEGEALLTLVRRIDVATPGGDVPLRVAVAVDRTELDAAQAGFLFDLAPYVALLALVLTATLTMAVAVALRPLSAIGSRVARLNAGDARRIGDEVPAEVMPLAAEIDALLEAREAEVEAARLRAADLAHGLKTPMQALLGEADRLRLDQRSEAALGIEEIVRAMQVHVDRELVRARRLVEGSSCDAVDVARSVAAVLRRTPEGAELKIDVDGLPGTMVRLDRADLAEALGALAENAVRHARARVLIACTQEAIRVKVRVHDDGSGAATTLLDLLPGRGLRLDEREGGSGLGLAIAADVAAAVGGSLRLRNLEPGFEAELDLPAA